MIRSRSLLPMLVLFLVAAPASADWASDYEDGMKAAGSGDWAKVVAKMTSAINAKPAENANMHTYGTIFIKYHPYYYRGIANFNLGKFEDAIRDLKKATGEGKVKIGSADSILGRAETQLAAQKQPASPQVADLPPAQPPPSTPAQTRPSAPAIDPNLAPARSAARESITAAETKMAEAQRAKAGNVPEFARAQELLLDARTKATQADTTSDWTAVATVADRSVSTFELAVTKSQIAAQQTKAPQVASAATDDALEGKRSEVRRAVQAYFSGEFQESVRAFDRLASRERDNALLWAFLGASHYYNWYLGGQRDDQERTAAIQAFRSAQRTSRNLRLDERYFPSRVREFYQQAVTN